VEPVTKPCLLARARGIETTVPEAEIPISIEVILMAPSDWKIYQKVALKALRISIISPMVTNDFLN
jgi:hypothetical protein